MWPTCVLERPSDSYTLFAHPCIRVHDFICCEEFEANTKSSLISPALFTFKHFLFILSCCALGQSSWWLCITIWVHRVRGPVLLPRCCRPHSCPPLLFRYTVVALTPTPHDPEVCKDTNGTWGAGPPVSRLLLRSSSPRVWQPCTALSLIPPLLAPPFRLGMCGYVLLH